MKTVEVLSALILILSLSFLTIYATGKDTDKSNIKTVNGSWNFTDDLGRSIETEQEFKKQTKYVGIFYHLLSEGNGKPNNASDIFENNSDALTNSKLWSKTQTGYYWGEPVFGYYDMRYDKYVIRKHAQLLCDAGVDTIIIDYTNAYVNGEESSLTQHYKGILDNLCDTFFEIRKEGGDTPKITFLLTWSEIGAKRAFEQLYKDFFSNTDYSDLWFHWNNKILVVGSGNMVDSEYHERFEFRAAWPFYAAPEVPYHWPWLSVYPQEPGYTDTNKCEVVAVSVAQNWREGISLKEFCFFSDRDENGNFNAQGRSYTYGNQKLLKDPVSNEYKSNEGANFNEQWERALKLDPDFIFITGWNELCVARFIDDSVIGKFCDQFTTEFSRDIEPTLQGDLKDNFYCQMVINIRKFKKNNISNYNEKKEEPVSNKITKLKTNKTINIDGAFEDWEDIALIYSDDTNDTANRDYKGYGTLHYRNLTGRNDFKTMKVAYDTTNIYFYVEAKDNITPFSDANWMNLFIGLTNMDGSIRKDLPNWEGYQFVLNRENVGDGITRLERCKGGWNWDVANDYVSYRVKDSKMEVAVPKQTLGIGKDDEINIIFKWSDNIAVDGNVMMFYTDGDTAPNSRFYYVFNNTTKKNSSRILLITVLILLVIAFPVVLIIRLKRKEKAK